MQGNRALVRQLATVAAGALVLAAVLGCGAARSESEPDARASACPDRNQAFVAKVGDDRVTLGEFDALMSESRNAWAASGQPYPKRCSRKYLDLVRQAVEVLVYRSRTAQAAASLGVTVSEDVVATEARRWATEKQLAEAGRTAAQVRADVRAELLEHATYKAVVVGIDDRDSEMRLRRRHAAWRQWLERTRKDFDARTVYAPGYDPARLPKNVPGPAPPLPQRTIEECKLGPGAYTYEELAARHCAGDFLIPGRDGVPCEDLYYHSDLWGGGPPGDTESGFAFYDESEEECIPPPGGEMLVGFPKPRPPRSR